jgi:TolB protein
MRWLAGFLLLSAAYAQIGEFEEQADIGASLRPGAAKYDAGVYTITGGGANMWFATDAFHFVWKRLSGDMVLTAKVEFEGSGGDPHRKAGWVVRQGLEPDAPYVDLVVHGDGLTSLQFRAARAGNTGEIRSPVAAPAIIRLQRHGDTFEMWVAAAGEPLRRVGSTAVVLHDPVYVGLAVCAHDAGRMETARFSEVKLQ